MRYRLFSTIAVLTLILFWSFRVYAATNIKNMNKTPQRDIPSPMYGVTIDSVDKLPLIVDSLHALSQKPTTRIVFDEETSASSYVKAVDEIHKVSYVMGELLDSFYVKTYSVDDYLDRTREYLDTLGSKVDIWEIGNEINGMWLGDIPTVVKKMTGAYDLVEQRGGKTALTLYHDQKSEDMLYWAKKYVPKRMKQNLDYVFVSFYEDSQGDIKPDWPMIFKRLATMFPNSKIGFGEVGTKYRSLKKSYIERYYKMDITQRNFVGGYFWWYFKQDMVPRSRPLWKFLNNTIATKLASVGSSSGVQSR